MKTLDESIARSMECSGSEIIEYLPYILQDFWEIGAASGKIAEVIRNYFDGYPGLRILDLGSGKGAVSIKIARELNCHCFGIDGVQEFVDFANRKAEEHNVAGHCVFEKNDVRERLKTLGKFDVVILAATGPVFDDYYLALRELTDHLTENGIVIIDDAYIDDGSSFNSPVIFHKTELYEQISGAGMTVVEENLFEDMRELEESYHSEMEFIEKRCRELINTYPGKAGIFREYMETQKKEYTSLSNDVTCVLLVVKKQ